MKTLKTNLILLLILHLKIAKMEAISKTNLELTKDQKEIVYIYPEHRKSKEYNLTLIFAEPFTEVSTEYQDENNEPKSADSETDLQKNEADISFNNVDETQSKDIGHNQTQTNNNSTMIIYEHFSQNLESNNTFINTPLENDVKVLNINSTMNSSELLDKNNNDNKKSSIKIKSHNLKLLQLLNNVKYFDVEKILTKNVSEINEKNAEIIKKSDVYMSESNEKMFNFENERIDQLQAEGSDHREIIVPVKPEDIPTNEHTFNLNPPEIIPFTLQDAIVNTNIENYEEWRYDQQPSENIKRHNNKKMNKKYNGDVIKSKKNQKYFSDKYNTNKMTLGYLLSMWSGYVTNGEPLMHMKLNEDLVNKMDRNPRQTLLIVGPIPKSLPASLYRTKHEPYKNQLDVPKINSTSHVPFFLTQ